MIRTPTLKEIRSTHARLSSYVSRTPAYVTQLDEFGDVALKLECLQRTGSFKVRGAINNMLALETNNQGVTAVSAGNHAIAVSYAARLLNIDAKVVMQSSANPMRVERARSYGANVLIADNGPEAFELAESIADSEQRALIHPFEGRLVTEATAGVAFELFEDTGRLDAVVVPIGGGGLASGIALASKLIDPNCRVYGVEPAGADVMRRSLASGKPESLSKISTMADSLGPPMTSPFAFEVCRKYLDVVVTVSDDEIAAAAFLLFQQLGLAVEPAGATALAGLLTRLSADLAECDVGIVVSGSNIDAGTFDELMRVGKLGLESGLLVPRDCR